MKQILKYFVRNPQAADSLEGVARWRLLEEQVHHSLGQTESALKWLVSQGYLEEIQISGAARIFRLAAKRQTEAASLLGEPPLEKGR